MTNAVYLTASRLPLFTRSDVVGLSGLSEGNFQAYMHRGLLPWGLKRGKRVATKFCFVELLYMCIGAELMARYALRAAEAFAVAEVLGDAVDNMLIRQSEPDPEALQGGVVAAFRPGQHPPAYSYPYQFETEIAETIELVNGRLGTNAEFGAIVFPAAHLCDAFLRGAWSSFLDKIDEGNSLESEAALRMRRTTVAQGDHARGALRAHQEKLNDERKVHV